jgi:hypothetical protein
MRPGHSPTRRSSSAAPQAVRRSTSRRVLRSRRRSRATAVISKRSDAFRRGARDSPRHRGTEKRADPAVAVRPGFRPRRNRCGAAELFEQAEQGARALQFAGRELLARVLLARAGAALDDGHVQLARPRIDEALALELARVGPEHPAIATAIS